jgi:S-adenosylmethionine decarboxylase
MTNYAGTHLILDFFGAENLTDVDTIKQTLIKAAEAIGATVLNVQLHYFEPQGGVTGVALLAESHMSIHTWPETKYAAIDIFVCGQLDPTKAIEILTEVFQPTSIERMDIVRGMYE